MVHPLSTRAVSQKAFTRENNRWQPLIAGLAHDFVLEKNFAKPRLNQINKWKPVPMETNIHDCFSVLGVIHLVSTARAKIDPEAQVSGIVLA